MQEENNPLYDIDNELITLIQKQNEDIKDYWSFKGCSTREHTHVFYQYPAMMIPRMQRELLNMIIQLQRNILNVLDPFVGSGTTMTESMLRGLNFSGQDVNPLAVLLCRAKMGPFDIDILTQKKYELFSRIDSDKSTSIDIYFPGLIKWFRGEIAVDLSRIRKAIISEEYLWVRRFFYVSLGETVRLCSNSRTTTYKLHIRKKEDIDERTIDTIVVFKNIVERNLTQLSRQTEQLKKSGFLINNYYCGKVNVSLKDSRNEVILQHPNILFDLVVTSPPYGDNKSTVPYGQSSFLPLQWVVPNDIDDEFDHSWLCTTHEIDSRSIGGRLGIDPLIEVELRDLSPAFSNTIDMLENHKKDRKKRVVSFFCDLNKAMDNISNSIRGNGYMIWTVGNRRVGMHEIPMDQILIELFKHKQVKHVTSIDRIIPHKRMPSRNNIAATMKKEQILIFRKSTT